MKMSFTLFAVLLVLSASIASCKKTKCGYCVTTCTTGSGGSSGTGYHTTTTNSGTVCDGDGGVKYAYDNAKSTCETASASGNGVCTISWIDK